MNRQAETDGQTSRDRWTQAETERQTGRDRETDRQRQRESRNSLVTSN